MVNCWGNSSTHHSPLKITIKYLAVPSRRTQKVLVLLSELIPEALVGSAPATNLHENGEILWHLIAMYGEVTSWKNSELSLDFFNDDGMCVAILG